MDNGKFDLEEVHGAEVEETVEPLFRDAGLSLRSAEVQEILGRPPRRIVRWGITVIFAVVFLLFFLLFPYFLISILKSLAL